jgi:hypothetical protein
LRGISCRPHEHSGEPHLICEAAHRVALTRGIQAFTGWAEQAQLAATPRAETDILPSSPPTSWLLRVGWQRGGPAPSVFEIPSARG